MWMLCLFECAINNGSPSFFIVYAKDNSSKWWGEIGIRDVQKRAGILLRLRIYRIISKQSGKRVPYNSCVGHTQSFLDLHVCKVSTINVTLTFFLITHGRQVLLSGLCPFVAYTWGVWNQAFRFWKSLELGNFLEYWGNYKAGGGQCRAWRFGKEPREKLPRKCWIASLLCRKYHLFSLNLSMIWAVLSK